MSYFSGNTHLHNFTVKVTPKNDVSFIFLNGFYPEIFQVGFYRKL